jgi:hypothetical protein
VKIADEFSRNVRHSKQSKTIALERFNAKKLQHWSQLTLKTRTYRRHRLPPDQTQTTPRNRHILQRKADLSKFSPFVVLSQTSCDRYQARAVAMSTIADLSGYCPCLPCKPAS